MKKYITQIVLFTSFLLIASCSNDDNNGNPDNGGSPANGTFTAKIDGVDFKADFVVGIEGFTDEEGEEIRYLMINTQQDDDDTAFYIMFNNYTGPGVYNVVDNNVIITIYKENIGYNSFWSAPYDNLNTGKITITSHANQRIKGNFEFTAQGNNGDNITNVTEGYFDFTLGFSLPTD